MEVLRLSVSSRGTKGNSKVPVKIVYSHCGKGCVDHFVEGGVQFFMAQPDGFWGILCSEFFRALSSYAAKVSTYRGTDFLNT